MINNFITFLKLLLLKFNPSTQPDEMIGNRNSKYRIDAINSN